jgi:hypothetical protein
LARVVALSSAACLRRRAVPPLAGQRLEAQPPVELPLAAFPLEAQARVESPRAALPRVARRRREVRLQSVARLPPVAHPRLALRVACRLAGSVARS